MRRRLWLGLVVSALALTSPSANAGSAVIVPPEGGVVVVSRYPGLPRPIEWRGVSTIHDCGPCAGHGCSVDRGHVFGACVRVYAAPVYFVAPDAKIIAVEAGN